jgi:hypothetical protein
MSQRAKNLEKSEQHSMIELAVTISRFECHIKCVENDQNQACSIITPDQNQTKPCRGRYEDMDFF